MSAAERRRGARGSAPTRTDGRPGADGTAFAGRPDDAIDRGTPDGREPQQPRLGVLGTLRYSWRQLTSMRTALFLLLLLALAAVPGSLVPQHSADPNGVTQYRQAHPVLYPILNSVQAFDTYTSVWFSAIYLLLFVSLVGCVLPRVKHHLDALRAAPPRTPARLSRLPGFSTHVVAGIGAADAVERARRVLRSAGYRAVVHEGARGEVSVSAERGYLRETGNLVFHLALLGILVAVAVGGALGYTGQRIVVTGQTFVDSRVAYDSLIAGRFFTDASLAPYSIRLDSLDVRYAAADSAGAGQPLDYTAHVTTREGGATRTTTIKVNDPLSIGGDDVYLLGNGYAPVVTVRAPDGSVVFHDAVPFLAQTPELLSNGAIKVPDGLAQQVGMVALFAPTAGTAAQGGGITSERPALDAPRLQMQVFAGDLGLDSGVPQSVYALDTDRMHQLVGRGTSESGIDLEPGQTEQLPDGLGSVTFDGVDRYASLDVHHDPTKGWMLVFAFLVLGGLLTSLFVPRRRVWVKAIPGEDGALTLEYAGLARGEDPGLGPALKQVRERHLASIPPEDAREPVGSRT